MKVATIFILALLLFNCKDDKVTPLTCDVPDPANDLPWLKQKIKNIEESGLTEYYAAYEVQHGTDKLITFYICCPLCSWVPEYYDCAGNQVQITDKMAINKIRDVWVPEGFVCVGY